MPAYPAASNAISAAVRPLEDLGKPVIFFPALFLIISRNHVLVESSSIRLNLSEIDYITLNNLGCLFRIDIGHNIALVKITDLSQPGRQSVLRLLIRRACKSRLRLFNRPIKRPTSCFILGVHSF